MNWTVQIVVPIVSLLVIGGLLYLCLHTGPSAHVAEGRREYRIHGAWYIFAAVGGALLVAIFAVASNFARPEDRGVAIGCSIGSAVFFALFAWFLRSLRVIVDDTSVSSKTPFGTRSVPLNDLDRIAVIGLNVELRRKVDPITGKRGGPLVFLAAFRGLREILATIRARAGLPADDPVL